MKRILAINLTQNLQYNFLSLLNVFLGFLFIILLGRKFGASEETDIYFLALVVISYSGIFIRSIWSAVKQYHIELKLEDKTVSDQIYNTLLINIIIFSLLVIGLYFFITSNFNVISLEKKNFLNVFIFYLLFQSLLNFNKTILNLEQYYFSSYLVDFIINASNLLIVIFFLQENILILAYSILIASSIALLVQFYLIYYRLNVEFEFALSKNEVVYKIYRNSFKMNIGGLLYSSKDILIAIVLTNYGSGIYSLYSYANKFVGVILQVVNAPIVNIFTTNISHTMAKKDYVNINPNVKKVLYTMISLYTLASVITFFVLPLILHLFFAGKFSYQEIDTIQYIFLYMTAYFLIVTVEGPYLTILNLSKMFNFVLFVNFVFFLFIGVGFLIFQTYSLNYDYFFVFLILAQLSNAILYVGRYQSSMNRSVL